MKKLIALILVLFWFVPFVMAEKCYVYIDKIGKVEKGQELGQNEKGDVVGIYPMTSQYKPTRGELDRYQIVVADLNQTEKDTYTEILSDGFLDEKKEVPNFIKARKYKIDMDSIKSYKQEQEIEKNIILDNTITKSNQ